ncbi:hypothetical protein QYQ98_09645 [Corynebacterium sp. P3-F1]|uniref:hypothetical protein n=1 Tax=Corynebacterium sp. P3-F1 TaxID=3059080 RepID=UPI00265CDB83|nr:hypothetical protein [Corynebacterium sp. P3-F1]WKK61261.1 hypothetical protein QYQ98_09645 [Corynebacterium sp. P3-F1]
MTSRRRATRFTSVITGASLLLAACGGNESTEVPQAAPDEPAGDVEIVTVTQYNDGTVLGPDDEVEGAGDEDEPEAVDEDTQDEELSDLAPGEFEYIGTVEKQTTEEVLKGAPDPNPSSSKPSDRYYVLVLDEPTEISAQKAGPEPYTQVNEIIALGDNGSYFDSGERWEPYVGKRVRLIVDKEDVSYASDTSLPLGAIRLREDRGRVEEL